MADAMRFTSLAFRERERRHSHGVYTGCPCMVTEGVTPPDNDGGIVRGHRALKVDPTYEGRLKQSCPRFVNCVRDVESNWNPNVKLPYGEWKSYRCASNKDGFCKWSLREEGREEMSPEEQEALDEIRSKP